MEFGPDRRVSIHRERLGRDQGVDLGREERSKMVGYSESDSRGRRS